MKFAGKKRRNINVLTVEDCSVMTVEPFSIKKKNGFAMNAGGNRK